MAILGALSIARSGLVATGEALSVTGNNIANVNTTAFKGSRSNFADLLSSTGGGASGGLGVRLAKASTSFTQGSIEKTGRPTDMAIEGNGFFVVSDGAGQLFTRAGNFHLDSGGKLVNGQGHPLQGFALDTDGNAVAGAADVDFSTVTGSAVATSRLDLSNNLSADAAVLGTFNGATFTDAYASSNYATTTRVFDSLGRSHEMTLFFTKTAANAWEVNLGVDAGETGGTAGDLDLVGTAALTFDGSGALTAPPPTDFSLAFSGADSQTITLDIGTPSATPGDGLGRDGLVQLGGATSVGAAQNGFGAGQLESLAVDGQGIVTGVFDNGQTRALYQLAIAGFDAPGGLETLGHGLYRATGDSGAAEIGLAGTGGLGNIIGAAIERANVELAQEFVDLISLQRSFQANARVITTSDGLLNDLISIVR